MYLDLDDQARAWIAENKDRRWALLLEYWNRLAQQAGRLPRRAEIDASHITVRTEAGRVILGGKVHAWYERDLAEQAAWSAPGVTEVQDQIEVQPWALRKYGGRG